MITFYPGPSKVYPQVGEYLQDAFNDGILSQNHRSQPFMDLMQETLRLLHEKLEIPADYHIYFVSSATECWEIISQSLSTQQSLYLYNGAFGKKWYEYARGVGRGAGSGERDVEKIEFGIDEVFPSSLPPSGLVCITQNETSNGTQVSMPSLENVPAGLLAIDATSSMAGIQLDWPLADVWFASVQKCFGLPAGLALMICSPKALEKAKEIGERNHYNSLLFIHENFEKYQTHYTPNVLGIYLLKRVMQHVFPISMVAEKIKKQAIDWYHFIENQTNWQLLVENAEVRSDTVIAVSGSVNEIKAIKERCKIEGITLGNGYGDWKDTSFRIANFPAIEDWEIEKLKSILKN